jgi:hypothetical protein
MLWLKEEATEDEVRAYREKRRIRSKLYAESHRAERAAYRRAHREEHNSKAREYAKRPEVRERNRQKNRLTNPVNGDKRRARMFLTMAVRFGYVDKPDRCEDCGTAVPCSHLHGHHWHGYSREHVLDVRWVCPSCHAVRHTEARNAAVD